MDISIIKKFNNPFAALRHRDFRYYWLGMCVSLIGTWMQNVAQPWLAYTLTRSPFLLSLVGALQFTPVLLFSLFAGVIIDKIPKKRLLYITQGSSLVITMILSILVFMGHIRYWHILVMATLLGVVNTLDMPARQAFIIELVGKDDLMNAISLNSTAFNLARIVGPALAGITMGALGMAACFFINSISFAAVIISLTFIKPAALQMDIAEKSNVFADIKDGLRYIFGHKTILNTILAVGIVGTFALNFNVLTPVFAKTILMQQETGFGFLMSFMGTGSFTGALFIAALSRRGPKRIVLNAVPFVIGLFLILTGFTNIYVLTGIMLALTGFTFICFSSTANTTVQVTTANEYRGRVMSVYTLVFSGTTPLGSLLAGTVTDYLGARAGFWVCGGAVIAFLLVLHALRPFMADKANAHQF